MCERPEFPASTIFGLSLLTLDLLLRAHSAMPSSPRGLHTPKLPNPKMAVKRTIAERPCSVLKVVRFEKKETVS